MILDLICITCIIVIITDLSGWPITMNRLISKILTKGTIVTSNSNLHIISCSFCQNWWVSLIYLIITHQLGLGSITIVLLLSFSTPLICRLLLLIKDLINKLIDTIYDRAI